MGRRPELSAVQQAEARARREIPIDEVYEVDLRKEEVRNLTRGDLETLAAGMSEYPPGRAGAAKAEILRRDREYAEEQEKSRQKFELKLARTSRNAVYAAGIAAFFSAVSALASLPQGYSAYRSLHSQTNSTAPAPPAGASP